MYSGDHVHECEWYLHTTTVLHHMLLSLPLPTEICMKVFDSVQIVFKMQVSILHPAFDTLCCLLLHGAGLLEHVVAHLTRAEESVALWTQTKKLLHRHQIQFVLEESWNIFRQLCHPTSEWRGFESRWFCRSGFEFAKTQLSILNH